MVKNWRQGTSGEEIINFTTTAIIATNHHQKWGGGGSHWKGPCRRRNRPL